MSGCPVIDWSRRSIQTFDGHLRSSSHFQQQVLDIPLPTSEHTLFSRVKNMLLPPDLVRVIDSLGMVSTATLFIYTSARIKNGASEFSPKSRSRRQLVAAIIILMISVTHQRFYLLSKHKIQNLMHVQTPPGVLYCLSNTWPSLPRLRCGQPHNDWPGTKIFQLTTDLLNKESTV